MAKIVLPVFGLLTLCWVPLRAQEIAGTWQGSLQAGAGIRSVLKIERSGRGGLKGMFYAIDQTTEGVPVSSIAFKDSVLRFSIDAIHGSYEGRLGADGTSIAGSWTQGSTWTLNFQRATKKTVWVIDPSPHTVRFVAVDRDVKLEVLDWGGAGRPVILPAGLGSTAHDFDTFAPKLTSKYHVYGITRRGFGASSAPDPRCGNYSADRLGDDVLAVMDALKIGRPVLTGHSIAGEELSSIGTRFPDRVAELTYLEAGNPYAYYDDHAAQGESATDSAEVREELKRLFEPSAPAGAEYACAASARDQPSAAGTGSCRSAKQSAIRA